MSNNGRRYQARAFSGTVFTPDKRGVFDACVMDTDLAQKPIALTVDIKSAITIAAALNRQAMQMARDQGNGDGN